MSFDIADSPTRQAQLHVPRDKIYRQSAPVNSPSHASMQRQATFAQKAMKLTRASIRLTMSRKTLALAGVQKETTTGTLSTIGATLNFFLIMIGSSVLSFPNLFKVTGLFLTPGLLLAGGAISIAMCLMEAAAITQAKRQSTQVIETLEDVGGFYLGSLGKYGARFVQNVSFVGDIMCFMVLIGNNLNYLFPIMNYQTWVGILTIFALSTVALKDATILEKLSVIGYVAPVVYFVAIIGGGMKALPQRIQDPLVYWVLDSGEVISVVTTMVFAFGPCDVIPTLLNEMSAPEDLPKALINSHIMVAILYATMGIAGYIGFGNDAEGNAVLSMCDNPGCPYSEAILAGNETPGQKWVFGYGLAAMAVANHLVGLLVNLLCVFMNLEAIFKVGETPVSFPCSIGMRVVTVVLSGFIGASLPYFEVVLGLISAIVAVPLIVVFPTAISYAAVKQTGMSRRLMLVYGLILIFGAVCLIVSIYEAIEELKKRVMQDYDSGEIA